MSEQTTDQRVFEQWKRTKQDFENLLVLFRDSQVFLEKAELSSALKHLYTIQQRLHPLITTLEQNSVHEYEVAMFREQSQLAGPYLQQAKQMKLDLAQSIAVCEQNQEQSKRLQQEIIASFIKPGKYSEARKLALEKLEQARNLNRDPENLKACEKLASHVEEVFAPPLTNPLIRKLIVMAFFVIGVVLFILVFFYFLPQLLPLPEQFSRLSSFSDYAVGQ